MNTEDIKDEEVKNTPEVEKTTAEATAEANTPAEETAEDLLAKEKDKNPAISRVTSGKIIIAFK